MENITRSKSMTKVDGNISSENPSIETAPILDREVAEQKDVSLLGTDTEMDELKNTEQLECATVENGKADNANPDNLNNSEKSDLETFQVPTIKLEDLGDADKASVSHNLSEERIESMPKLRKRKASETTSEDNIINEKDQEKKFKINDGLDTAKTKISGRNILKIIYNQLHILRLSI